MKTLTDTEGTPPASRSARAATLEIGGIEIAYRRTGRAGAPAVIVLHGVMGHHREWDLLVDTLAADHEVVVVDQRGHGASGWAPTYDIVSLVSDVEEVALRLGLHRVSVVGHSLGGLVGLGLAAKRPDLVESLAVLDVGPGSLSTEFGQAIPDIVATLGRTTYTSVDDAVAEWLAANPLARPDLMANYVEHALRDAGDGRLAWTFDGDGLARLVSHGLVPEVLWDLVDGVTCPTLVVRGSLSEVLEAREAQRLVERLADGRLEEIAGAGHDLGVEQPEAVAEVVAAFLTQARGGGEP